MSKNPRPSINDKLAEIAATSPTPATTPNMSRDNVVTSSRGDVVTGNVPRGSAADKEAPAGFKRRVRIEKPHASVYAHPRVFKALREIAAAQECKVHDLYLEGLRLVLQAHGRDFDALNSGE